MKDLPVLFTAAVGKVHMQTAGTQNTVQEQIIGCIDQEKRVVDQLIDSTNNTITDLIQAGKDAERMEKRNRSLESNLSQDQEEKRQALSDTDMFTGVHPSRIPSHTIRGPCNKPPSGNDRTLPGTPSSASSPIEDPAVCKATSNVIPPFTGKPVVNFSLPPSSSTSPPLGTTPPPNSLTLPPTQPPTQPNPPQVPTPRKQPMSPVLNPSAPSTQEASAPDLGVNPAMNNFDAQALLEKFYSGITEKLEEREERLFKRLDTLGSQRDEKLAMALRQISNELSHTKVQVEEVKVSIRQTETDLRSLLAAQGERIRLLEARSALTPGQDLQASSFIPANYDPSFLSEEDQKNLVGHIMGMSEEFRPEGAGPDHLRRRVLSMGVAYPYGDIKHEASPVREWAKPLLKLLSEAGGEEYNQMSLIIYPPGAKMPSHGDNESCLVPGSKIQSISLMTAWVMAFYHARRNQEVGRLTLAPGSKLEMLQEDQDKYHHAILPCLDGVRINITARRLKVKKHLKVALIGDSIVSGVNFGRNAGCLGPTLPGTNTFAALIETLPRPGTIDPDSTDIVLAVGVNNLKKLNQENTPASVMQGLATYHDRLANTLPAARIYLTEVLPVRKGLGLLNEEIVQYNKLLREFCSKSNITLLSSSVFADRRSGSLREDLDDETDTSAPGIHLNRNGTALVAGRIKFALKKANDLLLPIHLQRQRARNQTRPNYRQR